MIFREIIEKQKIEIPVIQRDYVQGLDEKKAKRFLKAIKKGMEGKRLNLDFIYGNEKNNKFIPIDGQQRLTTLFLLYFYLSLENEYIKDLQNFTYIKDLQNFTYAIRPSSKEFFEALTKKEHWEQLSKNNIVTQIRDSNWYFLSWENDLTVKSALQVLGMIEEKFKNNEIKDLDKIVFEFLNLKKYSLNEDLYIKMNARGKQLTEFENFKAEFEKYLSVPKEKAKLDNEWLDIFWKLDYIQADRFYYNFFFNTTLNFYIEKNDIDKKFLDQYELLDFYEDVYNDSENVQRVIKLLDNLDKYPRLKDYCSIKSKPEYDKRLDFYIWSLGILKSYDELQMQKWQRVAKNLVNNTRIESPEIFVSAIRELKKLNDATKSNVYEEIDFSNVKVFDQKQKEEEKLKIELILNNSEWENELIKAENHWYLNGQVGFLIDYAKNNLQDFIIYRDRFFILFNDSVRDDKKAQTMIQRALLTIEDYLPAYDWRKKTFCSFDTRLRVKNENWREVFGKEYFKSLLDSVYSFDDLKNLINNYTFDVDDWKSYFINPGKDWSVLEDIRNYQIAYINEQEIYLNAGNTTSEKWGWRNAKELYTWYLFKKFFKLKESRKRHIRWREEADIDENKYGIVFYSISIFSTNYIGIEIEKNGNNFLIVKDNKENKLIVLKWNESKEEYEQTGKEIFIAEIINNKEKLLKDIEIL